MADNNGSNLNVFTFSINEECSLANIKIEEIDEELIKTETEVVGGSWVPQNVDINELVKNENENENLEISTEQLNKATGHSRFLMPQKHCFIRTCPNNSTNAPQKLFLLVPSRKKPEVRRKWLAIAKYDSRRRVATKQLYCCEDHFDLSTDTDNWIYFKTIGHHLKVRKDVVPHKQLGSYVEPLPDSQLSDSSKKMKMDNIQRCRSSEPKRKLFEPENVIDIPSTSSGITHERLVCSGEQQCTTTKGSGTQPEMLSKAVQVHITVENTSIAVATEPIRVVSTASSPIKELCFSHAFSHLTSPTTSRAQSAGASYVVSKDTSTSNQQSDKKDSEQLCGTL